MSTLRSVRDAGQHPIVVRTIPHFGAGDGPYWNPSDCPMPRLLQDTDNCGVQQTKAAADKQQEIALRVEESAVRQTRTQWVDLRDWLCPEGRCSTHSRGIWMYRDGLHISTVASRDLSPILATALKQVPIG